MDVKKSRLKIGIILFIIAAVLFVTASLLARVFNVTSDLVGYILIIPACILLIISIILIIMGIRWSKASAWMMRCGWKILAGALMTVIGVVWTWNQIKTGATGTAVTGSVPLPSIIISIIIGFAGIILFVYGIISAYKKQ